MKVDALYIKYVGFGEDVISGDFLFDFYRIDPSRKKAHRDFTEWSLQIQSLRKH